MNSWGFIVETMDGRELYSDFGCQKIPYKFSLLKGSTAFSILQKRAGGISQMLCASAY